MKPQELRESAGELRTAAARARGADATDAVTTLGGALPGSSTATVLPQFAAAWDDGIDVWADSVDDFVEALETAASAAETADEVVRRVQEQLMGVLGGGS